MAVSRSLKVAATALFAAMAAVLEILPLDLAFPLYEKLTLDPTGIPLMLALYLFGFDVAAPAALITGIVIALPRPPFRGPNPVGAFFKSLAEISTLAGVCASRRLWRGKWLTLLASLSLGVAARAIVMTAACIALLPLFYCIPLTMVIGLGPVVAVFNVIQGSLNIVAGYLLYEALGKRLRSLTSPLSSS